MSDRVKDIYDIERRVLHNLIGQKARGLEPPDAGRRGDRPRPAAQPDRGARPRPRARVRDGRRWAHQPYRDRRPRHGHPGGRRAREHHLGSQRRRRRHHRRQPRRGHRQPRPRAARRARRVPEKAPVILDQGARASPTLPGQTKDGHLVSDAGQHRIPRRRHRRAHQRRRGHRPVPHRIPVPHDAKPSRPKEDHYDAYVDVLQRNGGRPMVIRTLDLGADKYTQQQLKNEPRAQPVPRRPLHPHVPPRHPHVQAATPRDHAGQRARRRADHVPHDQHPHGTPPGPHGAQRRDGGPRGRGDCPSAATSRSG